MTSLVLPDVVRRAGVWHRTLVVLAALMVVTATVSAGGLLLDKDAYKIDADAAPITAYLGALGMPGHTAWISLNRVSAAQPGETMLVSAATGAVGGVLGQLARLRGLKVIGTSGGPEKCAYAVQELGYHACIDHRAAPDTPTLAAEIADAAPDGVDVYHDNVGGRTLEAALHCLNDHARIVVCGMIAWFAGQSGSEPLPLPRLVIKRDVSELDEFIYDDFTIANYQSHPHIAAPVAV